jgi:hypothetical protein
MIKHKPGHFFRKWREIANFVETGRFEAIVEWCWIVGQRRYVVGWGTVVLLTFELAADAILVEWLF